MEKQKYVVGFLFDPEYTEVALITKLTPKWQEGKLNGIGGKVEEGERFIDAMVREFAEEAGQIIPDWNLFAILYGGNSEIHCFRTASEQIYKLTSETKEQVEVFDAIEASQKSACLPNVRFLIPMALTMDDFVAKIEYY